MARSIKRGLPFAAILGVALFGGAQAAADMAADCTGALALRYGKKAEVQEIGTVISGLTGFVIDGVAEIGGEGRRRFTCSFDSDRKFQDIVIRSTE